MQTVSQNGCEKGKLFLRIGVKKPDLVIKKEKSKKQTSS